MSERTSRHALGYGTRPLEGTEELKRCPFCGGIGQLWIVCSYTHWMVECGRCKAHAEIHKERAAAIAAWNQRAEPSPSAQLTAALGECALLTEACKELESELAAIENSLALACEREAALRADRDEAIGAALKVEQKNFDQAQELKALRADNSTLEVRLHQMMDISADRGKTITAYERELLPLRALREACQTYFGKYPFSDTGNIERALDACDEASAPTET